MYFTISRLVLEQCIGYPSPALQAGLFVDRIHSESLDETLRRHHQIALIAMEPGEIQVHLEQIAQFMLVHEVTHYCLSYDEEYRTAWRIRASQLLAGVATISPSGAGSEGGLETLCDAISRRCRDAQAWTQGKPDAWPELEELICDFSAVLSLVRALEKRDRVRTGFKDLMLSVWAAMAATWLIVMVRTLVRGLTLDGEVDLSHLSGVLQSRSGLPILLLAQEIGQKLSDDVAVARESIAGAWRCQPDFESLILKTFNGLFSAQSLERLLSSGATVLNSRLATPQSLEKAILRHFGWVS